MSEQTIKDETDSLFIKNREEARRFDNAISKLMPNTFPSDAEKDPKLKELKFNYTYARTMFSVAVIAAEQGEYNSLDWDNDFGYVDDELAPGYADDELAAKELSEDDINKIMWEREKYLHHAYKELLEYRQEFLDTLTEGTA